MRETALTHRCDRCGEEVMTIDQKQCPHCGSLEVSRLPVPSKNRTLLDIVNEPMSQQTLLDGTNCLPGQMDLF